MVTQQIDSSTISAIAAQEGTLSPAPVSACCCHRLRPAGPCPRVFRCNAPDAGTGCRRRRRAATRSAYRVEGSLTAAGLRDIFRDYLLPTVQEHFGEGADWWLLHDNDPGRHKSQVLRTFMHNKYVRPLDFPPYSPDLNPIENLWAEMDKRMASTQADTKEELEKLVAQEWAATSTDFCRKLARSMPKRIAQVIERGGAYTDY
jgi:hypothetical protein